MRRSVCGSELPTGFEQQTIGGRGILLGELLGELADE